MQRIAIMRRLPWALVAILLLGAALRVYGLGNLSLTLDEAHAYFYSSRSYKDIWVVISRWELSPPLYPSLQKVWRVFGTSEAAMRSLVLVFGMASILAVYVAGRRLGSDPLVSQHRRNLRCSRGDGGHFLAFDRDEAR